MTAFHYRFDTTVEDLVDADAIDRANAPRRIYRWIVERGRELERVQLLAIGGFVALGLIIFVWASSARDLVVIAVIVGAALLYNFVIAPRRARARIRAQGPAQRTMRLEVGREGVLVNVEDDRPVNRSWDEFRGATEAARGVLLRFGTEKMWIPRRAFTSDDERREFVKYVKQYEPPDTPP
jgi:hypothetical protein